MSVVARFAKTIAKYSMAGPRSLFSQFGLTSATWEGWRGSILAHMWLRLDTVHVWPAGTERRMKIGFRSRQDDCTCCCCTWARTTSRGCILHQEGIAGRIRPGTLPFFFRGSCPPTRVLLLVKQSVIMMRLMDREKV